MSKILAFLLVPALAVAGEPPKTAEQQFKNIQVLKGMPASQLDAAMDVMATALGVGCDHCHVEERGKPPAMDKDDKEAKRTARKMVTMMQKINHDFFGDNQEVTCATCHNGRAEPRRIPPLEHVAKSEEPRDEDAKAPSLTVKQILDKWVQASGGAAAWAKLRTRASKGSVEGFGPKPFGLEIVQAAPERFHMTLTMPNGTFEQAWDGKSGWRAFAGQSRPLDNPDEIRRQAQLAPPLTLTKLLTGLKVRPDAPLEKGGTAHVLEGRQGDVRVRLWLDAQTGLLARMSVRIPTPVGDLPQQFDYADYRAVDGVKLPFVIKANMGGEASVQTWTEIKHNAPVDDAMFTKPSAPPPPAPPAKAPQGK